MSDFRGLAKEAEVRFLIHHYEPLNTKIYRIFTGLLQIKLKSDNISHCCFRQSKFSRAGNVAILEYALINLTFFPSNNFMMIISNV